MPFYHPPSMVVRSYTAPEQHNKGLGYATHCTNSKRCCKLNSLISLDEGSVKSN